MSSDDETGIAAQLGKSTSGLENDEIRLELDWLSTTVYTSEPYLDVIEETSSYIQCPVKVL